MYSRINPLPLLFFLLKDLMDHNKNNININRSRMKAGWDSTEREFTNINRRDSFFLTVRSEIICCILRLLKKIYLSGLRMYEFNTIFCNKHTRGKCWFPAFLMFEVHIFCWIWNQFCWDIRIQSSLAYPPFFFSS